LLNLVLLVLLLILVMVLMGLKKFLLHQLHLLLPQKKVLVHQDLNFFQLHLDYLVVDLLADYFLYHLLHLLHCFQKHLLHLILHQHHL
jgi:hypothetical protein